MNNSKTKKNLRKTLAVAACVPMLAALFTAVPAGQQANASTATDLVGEGNTYYEIESKDHQEAVSMLNQAQLEIAREGMVLLKNEDNVLPMKNAGNVTVFGNGQNRTAVRTNSITGSLEAAGFKLNPTVKQFYSSDKAPWRSYQPGNGHNVSGYQTYEAPVSTFDFDAESAHFADYSDAAFVVISRVGGEGSDLPTRMAYNPGSGTWGGFDDWDSDTPSPGARSADDHYLQLDQYGICASSGSACTSGSLEPSHVLRAMGVPFNYAHGSVRFSLSRYNTGAEIERVIEVMPTIVSELRKISPFAAFLKK